MKKYSVVGFPPQTHKGYFTDHQFDTLKEAEESKKELEAKGWTELQITELQGDVYVAI